MGAGIIRLPVFWEDDIHWEQSNANWNFKEFMGHFTTPGLKIINFHPFLVAINAPNEEYYKKVKAKIKTLSKADIETVRYKGKGARTFLIELLDYIKLIGEKGYTLNELYAMFREEEFSVLDNATKGRVTIHSNEEYKKYWKMKDNEKQEFLRKSYESRNAGDIYATSRDFNLRELEIEIIRKHINGKGKIVDIGCGNGYTLISLAKSLEKRDMMGIDFTKNLIDGAKKILEGKKKELKSIPSFIHADALEFLRKETANKYGTVISERFIQNLPSQQIQQEALINMFRILSKGGILLLLEGSEDGFNSLNEIRNKVGLSIISPTSKENVSAIRVNEPTFEEFLINKIGYKIIGKFGFSYYFAISRVFYPLYISPQNPRFDSKINDIAKRIQENLPYNPGLGSNVLWVLQKL